MRCDGCNMPATSGPLYCVGKKKKCGMCLWADVDDLRRRIRLARRAVKTSGAPYTLEAIDLLDLRRPLPSTKRGPLGVSEAQIDRARLAEGRRP